MCSLVDNIDVDVATGDLWIAGHADGDLLAKHITPPHTAISPSQVYHVYLLCTYERLCIMCLLCMMCCLIMCSPRVQM